MAIKNFTFLLIVLLSVLKNYSQSRSLLSYDLVKCTIEFKEGQIIDAFVLRDDVVGAVGKDKIKVYKTKDSDAYKAIPISDLSKMVLHSSEKEVALYKQFVSNTQHMVYNEEDLISNLKVIYSTKKRIPRLCRALFIGKNLDFYSHEAHTTQSPPERQIFITKSGDSTAKYHFFNSNSKDKTLKALLKIFKNCEAFANVANKQKADAKYEMAHFYKLIDKKCN